MDLQNDNNNNMSWYHYIKKRFPIPIQIISILYLLFLITSQAVSPTTAYFVSTKAVDFNISAAEMFGEDNGQADEQETIDEEMEENVVEPENKEEKQSDSTKQDHNPKHESAPDTKEEANNPNHESAPDMEVEDETSEEEGHLAEEEKEHDENIGN